MIGDPWMLRLIRKETDLSRIFPHFDFRIEENVTVELRDGEWHYLLLFIMKR